MTQMLYTGNASEELEKIYKSYCKKGGKELLCMAYLTYFSHLYLVKNRMPSAQVFLQIEERMQRQKELNDAQKYALLKYYAGKRYLSSVQYEIADILLLECSIRGVGFSFFKQLDARLQAKYQIYDKYYLEYHRKPGIYVRIRYRINDEAYEEEELKEVYDGIYAKELVLFLGDTVVSWILDEEREEEQRITVTEEFFRKNSQKNREKNRYTMLNEMLCDAAAQKTEHLKAQMLAYQKKKSSAETVFELL